MAVVLLTACSRPPSEPAEESLSESSRTALRLPESGEDANPRTSPSETGVTAEAATVAEATPDPEAAGTDPTGSTGGRPPEPVADDAAGAESSSRLATMSRPLDFDRLERAIYEKYELRQLDDPLVEFDAVWQRADAGDVDALFDLALLLAHGDRDLADPVLAAELFSRAGESGMVRASTELGRLYLTGHGVPVDLAQAERLFSQAWQAGDPEGAFLLATAYRHGLFRDPDPEQARSLLTAAAERGHVAAVRALYARFREGEIGDADSRISAWLQAAAETGDVGALLDFAGYSFRTGKTDVAFGTLETAADAGSSDAAVQLIMAARGSLNDPEERARVWNMLELQTHGSGPAAIKAFELLGITQVFEPDRALATTRARDYFQGAADLGSYRAQVTLQLLDRGMNLPQALNESRTLSEDEAYVRSIELSRESAPAEPASRPPRPISVARAEYPAELRAENLAGEVTVELIVQADGSVKDVHATAATHPAFATAAEAAVREWRFDPGMRNGSPVATKLRVPIQFQAKE